MPVRCLRAKPSKEDDAAPPWRWMMLGLFSLDICVSYLPYYAFVPIPRQAMQVYGVDEAALNVLCIMYALVYVPAAFVTGPIVGALGCKWTFVFAMALNVVGCALRCGPAIAAQVMLRYPGSTAGSVTQGPGSFGLGGDGPTPDHGLMSTAPVVATFMWLLVGQAFCALGQTLLVNTTSEMSAEWFPPHERPTAALVSNLMNFVGSSLSYILPPLIVKEENHSLQEAEHEVAFLMRVQLWIAILSFLATLFLYQRAPVTRPGIASHEAASCLTDVMCMVRSADFWIVTLYFSVYMAAMHAFDAVEGSLMEHYGFRASLSAWTAVSCAIASIVSTLLEAQCITSARQYRSALVVATGFIIVSMLLCFACLYGQMHAAVFVVAVGIFGLATPGWGCSCELGSEVAYPAREATVSSVMEAFGNLSGVFSIIATQRLLDSGMGAGVLLVLGGATVLASGALAFLSGRLQRTEAEEAEEAAFAQAEAAGDMEATAQLQETEPDGKEAEQPPLEVVEDLWLRGDRKRTQLGAIVGVCVFLLFCRVLLFLPQSQLPEELTDVATPQSIPAQHPLPTIDRKPPPQPGWMLKQAAPGGNTTVHRLPNNFPPPVNYVISCNTKTRKFKRFQNHAAAVGLQVEVVPCVAGTPASVSAAVREGLLPESAKEAATGLTAQGTKKADLMGLAISHLRLLKTIAGGRAEVANVFEEDEVVYSNFLERRNELLGHLPHELDLAKLNVRRPAGRKVDFTKSSSLWMRGNVFRMTTLSPKLNVGMSNYLVTRRGARKLLKVGRKFDSTGRWESFDQHALSVIYPETRKRGGFIGFTVQTDLLSVNCHKSRHTTPAQVKFCGA